MRLTPSPVRRAGFTLIEVLVVIGIIVLLIALLVPAVQAARESGRRTGCTNNLKQIALAFHTYHEQFGSLPFSQRVAGSTSIKRHGAFTSILPYLDQQGLFTKYDFKQDWFDSANSQNKAVASARISSFLCPSSPQTVSVVPTTGVPATFDRLDDKPDGDGWSSATSGWAGVTDYAPVTHVGPRLVAYYNSNLATSATSGTLGSLTSTTVSGGVGIMAKNVKSSFAQVRDGLSNTIFIAESAGRPQHYTRGGVLVDDFPTKRVNGGGWARNANDISIEGFTADGLSSPGPVGINASNGEDGPSNYNGTNYSTNGTGAPFAFHPGGANFAFGDGSVHFLSEKMDIGVLIRLSTREAGDVIDTGAAGL